MQPPSKTLPTFENKEVLEPGAGWPVLWRG